MEMFFMYGAIIVVFVSIVLSKKHKKSPPWYLIILGFTLLSMLITGLFLARDMFPISDPPSRLLLPPSPAKDILGVKTGGFYQADPWILATDEQKYLHLYVGEDGWEWSTDYSWPGMEAMIDQEPCDSDVIELISTSSGDIKQCQTVHPYGEWCPAPITSFAVTQEGVVWKYEKQLPCTPVIAIWLLIAGVAGFALGVATVLLKAIILRL